jgi:hypothetical protein
MDTKHWITAILATYGAILSSYLAIREILKERRQLKIILEYVAFREIARLIITNSGHRPVTITDIAADVYQEGDEGNNNLAEVPQGALISGDYDLPKLLSDGQTVIYELGAVLSGIIIEGFSKEKNVHIAVFDAEGNSYTKYERRMGNAKWGGSEKIDK